MLQPVISIAAIRTLNNGGDVARFIERQRDRQTGPDGGEVSATAGASFTATDQPGVYTVTPGTLRFVVNLAPEESRTSPLTPDRFTALGIPLRPPAEAPMQLAKREARAQAAEIENRQKLWRWLIVAALGVLLLETLIAGKLSRIPAAQT